MADKQTHHFESASDFVRALVPLAPTDASILSDRAKWIYRGQANADWDLRPSAFRSAAVGTPAPTVADQYATERELLRRFFDNCDRAGLAIPGDCPDLRTLLHVCPVEQDAWTRRMDTDLLPLAAIAQHHGVPTRLLDWTWNPLTAAYFAATGETPAGRLGVWALSIDIIERGFPMSAAQQPYAKTLGGTIHAVTAPTASNPNLRAQEGLFTEWAPHPIKVDSPGDPPDCTSIDGVIWESGAKAVRKMLVQLTVPTSEREELLHHLGQLGINECRLFPGYDTAARIALSERAPAR